MKNYVNMAANAYYHRDGIVTEIKEYYNEATDRFSMIHVLIGLAYTEALKVTDYIDDNGMRKQMIKKILKPYDEKYNAYRDHLRSHMKQDAMMLLQDYSRAAWAKAAKKANLLRQACYNHLKNNGLGIEECKLLAQCEVALLLWTITTETHELYFKSYKELCGVDFSKDFDYADMTICHSSWRNLTLELAKRAKSIDFNDSLRCRNAWTDLKEEIDRTDFFDEAAREALKLNPQIMEKYKDVA